MTLTIKPSPYGYSIEDLQQIVSTADSWNQWSFRTVTSSIVQTCRGSSLSEHRLDTIFLRQRLNEEETLHEQYRSLFQLMATDGPKEPANLIACADIVRTAIVDMEAERLLAKGESWLQIKDLFSITKRCKDIGPLRFTVAVKSVNGRLVDQFGHAFLIQSTKATTEDIKQIFYPTTWVALVRRHIDKRLGLYVPKLWSIEDPDLTFKIEVSKWDLARYAILHYKWS